MDDRFSLIRLLPATWVNRFISALGGVTNDQERLGLKHAFESGMEAADINADEPYLTDSSGKPITFGYEDKKKVARDLSRISQEKAIEASYRIWQTNPLGKALTEILVDFIVGEGLQVTCKNEEVREIVDTFLTDDVNQLNEGGAAELTRELSLFGELLILMFVRYGDDKIIGDGRVRFGTIDPSMIESVITHPENRRDVYAIRIKGEIEGTGPLYMVIREETSGKNRTTEGNLNLRRYREAVIQRNSPDNIHIMESEGLPEDPNTFLKSFQNVVPVGAKEWLVCGDESNIIRNTEATDRTPAGAIYDGQCFLAQVNKLSTGTRGRPDWLPMIDWIDQLDNVFFDGVEHVQLLNLFAWDLTVTGGSSNDPDIDRNLNMQAARVSKLRSKSVYAHNENVDLEAVNPSLHTSELETITRSLRVFVSGGARIPEHWLSEGGYTNRATAAEMGQPTYKMLTSRQRVIKNLLTRMIRFVIDVHVQLGLLPEIVDVETRKKTIESIPARDAFEVVMSEINVADTSMASTALLRIVQAVVTGISGKIISREVGMEILVRVIQILGIEIDAAEMMEDINETEDGQSELGMTADLVALVKQYVAQSQDQNPQSDENEEMDQESA